MTNMPLNKPLWKPTYFCIVYDSEVFTGSARKADDKKCLELLGRYKRGHSSASFVFGKGNIVREDVDSVDLTNVEIIAQNGNHHKWYAKSINKGWIVLGNKVHRANLFPSETMVMF